MIDEIEVINRAKEGDSESFGKLYDCYITQIYRFVYLKVQSKQDAEDLTHQVFLKAWQNIHTFNSQGFPFSSWLYRIATNSVIDFYRVHRKHANIDEIQEEYLARDDSPETKVDIALEIDAVRVALLKLEHDQQNVIVLRFVNNLTTKEIAESLDKTEGAIRVIQHRALKSLRKQLEGRIGESHTTYQ